MGEFHAVAGSSVYDATDMGRSKRAWWVLLPCVGRALKQGEIVVAKDLRSFLKQVEANAPSELVRVARPVSPIYELPGVLRKLQSENRYPGRLVRGRGGIEAADDLQCAGQHHAVG